MLAKQRNRQTPAETMSETRAPITKVPYETPALTVLGTIAELTAGSTSGGTDTAGLLSATVSDRRLKQAFAPIDVHAVLTRAATLPLSTWSYKTDEPAIRHIGPMAQDFHAAFGVGDDGRTIHAVDAGGVALACIQALHAMVQERDAQISALWAELEAMRQRLDLTGAPTS